MLKLLIIGAQGNLGTQINNVFSQDDGYDATVWDKSEVDITDRELVLKKLSGLEPDIIINCAAYNAVDLCEEDDAQFELALKLNRYAVGNLADAALRVGAVIVHYSTDYVFDGEKREGYAEKDTPKPISRYAKSKKLGEDEVISRSGKGLKWYLIRSSKLFGPMGEFAGAKKSFFDLIIDVAGKQQELQVVDGEELSCFTYTVDLARATKKLAEDRRPWGIYHITNSGESSWYDGAVEVFRIKGIKYNKLTPIKSADYPRPAKRPKYSVLLNTKLEPLRDWKEALREYYSN